MAANGDIRIAVTFWEHIKTIKLERRLGLGAIKSLTLLWMWAAQHRPNGDLSGMDDEEIAIVAKWNGRGDFIAALCEIRWLDGEAGNRTLHDWMDHNPWAFDAEKRELEARFNALKKWKPELANQLAARGINSLSKGEYELLKRNGNTEFLCGRMGSHKENGKNPMHADMGEHMGTHLGTHENNARGATWESDAPSAPNAPVPVPVPVPDPLKELSTSTIVDFPANLTPEEREILNVIKGAKGGYQYDFEKDLKQIRTLSVEFPHVDMLSECKKMADWLIDKPPTKVKNSRSFMRNWISNAKPRASPAVRVPPPAISQQTPRKNDYNSIITGAVPGTEEDRSP